VLSPSSSSLLDLAFLLAILPPSFSHCPFIGLPFPVHFIPFLSFYLASTASFSLSPIFISRLPHSKPKKPFPFQKSSKMPFLRAQPFGCAQLEALFHHQLVHRSAADLLRCISVIVLLQLVLALFRVPQPDPALLWLAGSASFGMG
jgi:hypothetical protein